MNLIDLKNYLSLVNPDTEMYCFLLRNDSLSIFNRTASTTHFISILITEHTEKENTFKIFSEDNHLSNYFSWLYDVAKVTLLNQTHTREHSFENYALELKD